MCHTVEKTALSSSQLSGGDMSCHVTVSQFSHLKQEGKAVFLADIITLVREWYCGKTALLSLSCWEYFNIVSSVNSFCSLVESLFTDSIISFFILKKESSDIIFEILPAHTWRWTVVWILQSSPDLGKWRIVLIYWIAKEVFAQWVYFKFEQF